MAGGGSALHDKLKSSLGNVNGFGLVSSVACKANQYASDIGMYNDTKAASGAIEKKGSRIRVIIYRVRVVPRLGHLKSNLKRPMS